MVTRSVTYSNVRLKLSLYKHCQSFLFICRPFIDGFLIVYQAGICCVYVVFVGQNIKPIFDQLGKLDARLYMTLVAVLLIGLMCIRNLKILAPFSLLSNVLTLVGKRTNEM